MTRTYRNFFLLLCMVFTTPALAQESCVVAGDTLSQARQNYNAQCNVERVDCDPYDGVWYCASFRMTTNTPPALTLTGTPAPVTPDPIAPAPTAPAPVVPVAQPDPEPTPAAPVIAVPVTPPSVATPAPAPVTPEPESTPVAEAPVATAPPTVTSRPSCTRADSDPDGDGFGWENNNTCLVTNATPVNTAPVPQAPVVTAPVVTIPVATAPAVNSPPDCASANSDSDGDGFGWENNQSCVVTASSVVQAPVVIQSGGSVDTNNATPSTETTAKTITAADITDLILITGQSNALGAGTSYNPNLDGSNPAVFAFTNNGWQVANLRQIWDKNWFPRTSPDTDPSNNLSLHFGKHVAANDSSRVIGFVLASEPGAAISSWELDRNFYPAMEAKALDAINQLPHKSAIDGILWHQGESDGRDEQYYTDALYSLISNLRNEPWVTSNAPFICGETKIASVNNRLNGLNTDSDPNTACVRGIDLPTLGDDRHFNAEGLRTLGVRYGEAYLDIVN